MQAPLSSTASGQQLRTGPPAGLPPFTTGSSTIVEYGRPEYGRPEDRTGALARPFWKGTAPGNPDPGIAVGAGLAHDAGNLLGALRLYCDLLARPGVLREEHHHYAEELQLLSARSSALIDRLLHPGTTRRDEGLLGGREPGPARTKAPAVIVPEVIDQCRGLLNTIAQRAVSVAVEAGGAMPVPVSREAIERILVNLTKNAAEASAAGGGITLRVSCLREHGAGHGAGHSMGRGAKAVPARVLLSVEDQGRGMSVAAVKVLLEGASGADLPVPSASAQRPRGLGLRVVRELVRETGGELRLKSRSGCGTTVEIAWAVTAEGDKPGVSNGPERQRMDNNGSNGTEGGVQC